MVLSLLSTAPVDFPQASPSVISSHHGPKIAPLSGDFLFLLTMKMFLISQKPRIRIVNLYFIIWIADLLHALSSA